MSSMPSVTASNGIFTVTNASGQSQQVDLGTLMMMLNLERTENLDAQIADLLTEIQDRNDQIKSMTKLLGEMRTMKSNGNSGTNSSSIATKAKAAGIIWTEVKEGRSGKSGNTLTTWNSQWDANIDALKGQIDLLNNDSQMSNIRLQNLLEKRTNAFEMASKVMDTNNQSVESTIRNL